MKSTTDHPLHNQTSFPGELETNLTKKQKIITSCLHRRGKLSTGSHIPLPHPDKYLQRQNPFWAFNTVYYTGGSPLKNWIYTRGI